MWVFLGLRELDKMLQVLGSSLSRVLGLGVEDLTQTLNPNETLKQCY